MTDASATRRWGRRRDIRVAVALTATMALVGGAAPAFAEGSRNLYPSAVTGTACAPNTSSGSCRANIEWRTNRYGPTGGTQIYRRTMLSAYLQAGEVLEMGSTAVGVGSGDIVAYSPGVVTDRQGTLPAPVDGSNAFLCSAQRTASGILAQGKLTTRAQEVGGPSAPTGATDANHYVPCWFQAATTGIYDIAFYGPDGDSSQADGAIAADLALTAAADTDTTQRSSVAAWDLTVRADTSTTTDIDGRVFTYALAAFTGGNGRPVNMSFYVTTTDGYRYRTDTRGLDPNGFLIYANDTGFRAPDGSPLEHDAFATAGGSAMSTIAGGVDFSPPRYPISFQPIASETLTALGIPLTPVAPVVASATFTGNLGGNNSAVAAGGTFHVDGNVAGVYQIVISRDGADFDPGNPSNRVLLADLPAGPRTIAWDGKDNAGTTWPAGTNFAFRTSLHGGVYHFPLLDAENSTLGGPTFTLTNPPGATCPFGRPSCTTAFYDDRGYHTSAGDVGTPGSPLCGLSAPAVAHSDPVTGYDSAGSQRAFGLDTGGNTNASCTGGFGDLKGLDTWTFYPSNTAASTLNVLTLPAAPVAAGDSGTTAAGTPLVVPAPGVLANDTGTSITVTSNTQPAHGTATVNADGSYTYTPVAGYSGADSFTYTVTDPFGQTAGATVTLTVNPVAVDDARTTPARTPVTINSTANDLGSGLTVTAVTQPAAGTGSVAITSGQPRFTPAAGFSGTAAFTYTVTDAAGHTATATDTVTVTPVAIDDATSTAFESPVPVDVLTNDHGSALTLSGVTQPPAGQGSVSVSGNQAVFAPANGFTGTATFGYTATDASGQQATAQVTVSVAAPGAPGAANDTGTTAVNTPLTIGVPGVLTNDSGTRLTVASHTSPAHGTLTVGADGSYTYTPDHDFSGFDSFGYLAEDAAGQQAAATVSLTVTPQAVADTVLTPYLTPIPVGVRANDHGSGLTVTAVTQPPAGEGTVAIVGGEPVYTPPAGYGGTTTFGYTVTDAAGQPTTATVTVTVAPPPVAHDDVQVAAPGQPVTLDPLANDTPSGPSASFIRSSLRLVAPVTDALVLSLTMTAQGTYTADPGTGLITFLPVTAFAGAATPVRYQVTDTLGHVTVALIEVTYSAALGNGVLAGTGRAVAPLAATGGSLLLLGVLLVTTGRRRRFRRSGC